MASITATTSGESGTQSITISLAAATPAASPPSNAPSPTARSIGPRRRDATVTVCPASRRWRVIGSPIAPSPTNPTFMTPRTQRGSVTSSATRWKTTRDRFADLDGGGVDLVDGPVGRRDAGCRPGAASGPRRASTTTTLYGRERHERGQQRRVGHHEGPHRAAPRHEPPLVLEATGTTGTSAGAGSAGGRTTRRPAPAARPARAASQNGAGHRVDLGQRIGLDHRRSVAHEPPPQQHGAGGDALAAGDQARVGAVDLARSTCPASGGRPRRSG